jgi:hypothetical protein
LISSLRARAEARLVDQVVASYHRARRSGELFDTLYDIFLHKSPEIPPMDLPRSWSKNGARPCGRESR